MVALQRLSLSTSANHFRTRWIQIYLPYSKIHSWRPLGKASTGDRGDQYWPCQVGRLVNAVSQRVRGGDRELTR